MRVYSILVAGLLVAGGCGSTQTRTAAGPGGCGAGCGAMTGGGVGGGAGSGGCVGVGASAAPVSGGVSSGTRDALYAALADERRARAFYQAVLDKHGRVMPFANIVRAESMHAQHVVDLMEARGLDVPADTATFPADDVPGTVAECCVMAMEAEVDNVALYDEWLARVDDESVRAVFERLQWMSQERHLPAFERHAGRG